jgi:hypothetical protein
MASFLLFSVSNGMATGFVNVRDWTRRLTRDEHDAPGTTR